MVSDLKKIVRDNALRLIKKATGPLKPNESGVTRLVALGMTNGTAQRILDDITDMRLETVEQLAAALKVTPIALMTPDAQAPAMLFRDLDSFEGMLLTLFRELPNDSDRHSAIVELNQRRDLARERERLKAGAAAAPDSGNPYAGKNNRREVVLGRTPERRNVDRLIDSPLTHHPREEDDSGEEETK